MRLALLCTAFQHSKFDCLGEGIIIEADIKCEGILFQRQGICFNIIIVITYYYLYSFLIVNNI